MSGQRAGLWVLTVALVGGVAAGTYALWPGDQPPPVTPPAPPAAPPEQTPERAAQYMASAEFAALDPAKKQAYFDGLVEKFRDRTDLFDVMRKLRTTLSEEQQDRLRKIITPLAVKAFEREVDAFLAMPAAERTAYLDKRVDQMVARRKAREAQRAAREREAGTAAGGSETKVEHTPRRRGPNLARFREQIDSVPPEKRAKFIEFMLAFRRRMQERGVEMRPGPPPAR